MIVPLSSLQTQEKLIAAFQKENERLMHQIKRIQQDTNYDVHAANESLRRQLEEAKLQAEGVNLSGSVGDRNRQLRDAVDARLQAEARALSLQDELHTTQQLHQQKVNELRLELDRVKKAKVELECRYEGIDMSKVARESQQVQDLQQELSLKVKEHSHAMVALQKKLDWYVENQRLLDEQDGVIGQLKQEVLDLKAEVESVRSHIGRGKLANDGTASSALLASPSPVKTRGVHPSRRSPADIRRIQELETRVAEMEAAMRKRHPDSLVNLILASRKADEESKIAALEADHADKIRALEHEMEDMHEAHEKKMKSFRQQHERLLLQYQRRTHDSDVHPRAQATSSARVSNVRTAAHRRPKDEPSSEELARVRQFYASKLKDMERKWEAKYRALKKQQFTPGSGDRSSSVADMTSIVETLQRQLQERDRKLHQLREQLDMKPNEASPAKATLNDNQVEELRERVDSLEKQLRASEDAREQLVQTLSTVQRLAISDALTAKTDTSHSPVLDQLRNQVRQELATEFNTREVEFRKQVEADIEAAHDQLKANTAEAEAMQQRLQQQVEELSHDKQKLQRQVAELEADTQLLEKQAQRANTLEEELVVLRRRAAVPQTPSMVQYSALEMKIETLSQKHALREAELRVLLEQAMSSRRLERLSRERAHRNIVAAKNAEIAVFRQQLGEILEELANLQAKH